MIGIVCATEAGRRNAAVLIDALPEVRLYDGPVATAITAAWFECDAVVAFMATGAAVRLVAPLLKDKHTDPALLCVDEAARFAVAVLGGHEGGANELAHVVADLLGAEPVVTTASDATGLPFMEQLARSVGGRVEDNVSVAAVTRAMLDGDEVALVTDVTWPLPAMPGNVRYTDEQVGPSIVISDRVEPVAQPAVVIRPRSLVLGLGASRGVSADEVLALVDSTLARHGLATDSVGGVATVDAKADEPGLLEAADARGWSLRTYPADDLAAIEVPNPSDVVQAAVGTPSVAEAAAVLAAGPGAALVVPKTASAMATVAVARKAVRGRLAIVGIGPGVRDLLTPRAVAELRRASIVVGLDQYLEQIRDLLRPGTRLEASGLGDEEARAHSAVDLAREGHAVALVGSGDASVYAMASPALEFADETIDVVVVPGVTAMLAAAAEIAGAPLGHDHCAISLSDLHTPWEVIEQRVRAAAEGDFVVAFYNPRSRSRDWQLPKALAVLATHRVPETPVAVVTNATRAGASAQLTTLGELDVETVGMFSIVIVGSSQSRYVAGRFVTPRGYTWAG